MFDANVTIDYLNAGPVLLREISRGVGPVLIPDVVQEEVGELSLSEWQKLSVVIVRASTTRVHELWSRDGRLSWADHACLWVAADRRGVCVSNDERLRQECDAQDVPTLWGLEPLIRLARVGRITLKSATRAVLRMQTANLYHINEAVVRGFLDKIGTG